MTALYNDWLLLVARMIVANSNLVERGVVGSVSVASNQLPTLLFIIRLHIKHKSISYY